MLKLITPAASKIVSVAELKSHLQLTLSAHDSYLGTLIAAAQDLVERQTGRVFGEQTWAEVLPCFPSAIELQRFPVASIEAITYYDADDEQQEFEDFQAVTGTHNPPCTIHPVDCWPDTYDRPDAVTVQYVCDGTTPEIAKHAVKLLAATWFDARESEADVQTFKLDAGLDRVINQLRLL